MQHNFLNPVLRFTLSFEGGFSNDKRDPGGATMHGITQATYDAYRRRNGVPHRSVIFIEQAEVEAIYRSEFWMQIEGDALDNGVDLMAFDIAVNNGPGRARLYLRETDRLDAVPRVIALDKLRTGFWARLPTWAYFGTGWMRRERACLALAQKMQTAPVRL